MRCPSCGTELKDAARFCVSCGTPLVGARQPGGRTLQRADVNPSVVFDADLPLSSAVPLSSSRASGAAADAGPVLFSASELDDLQDQGLAAQVKRSRRYTRAGISLPVLVLAFLLAAAGVALAAFLVYQLVTGWANETDAEDETVAAEELADTFSAEELYSALSAFSFSTQASSSTGSCLYELYIYEDGSCSGIYHDESALASGMVSYSAFDGVFADAWQLDEFVFCLEVGALELADATTDSYTVDGITYLPGAAPGLAEGSTLTVYAPGMLEADLPRAVAASVDGCEGVFEDGALAVYLLYVEDEEIVFVGTVDEG